MGTVEVVMLEPGREMPIAFLRIEVMAKVGRFAQSGLDEAFRLAVSAGSVGTGEAVRDAELEAGGTEVSGAIAGAVVGEQAANGDAVLGVEGYGGVQEGDGGLALLVGEHAGKGEAGVIVDGDVQSLPAGELWAAAPPTVATNGDLLIAGHALDVEMQQIAGSGMLVAHDGRERNADDASGSAGRAAGCGLIPCGVDQIHVGGRVRCGFHHRRAISKRVYAALSFGREGLFES